MVVLAVPPEVASVLVAPLGAESLLVLAPLCAYTVGTQASGSEHMATARSFLIIVSLEMSSKPIDVMTEYMSKFCAVVGAFVSTSGCNS
jgi:hypothetical protein